MILVLFPSPPWIKNAPLNGFKAFPFSAQTRPEGERGRLTQRATAAIPTAYLLTEREDVSPREPLQLYL